MGKSRGPKINEEGLARHLSEGMNLTALRNRFLQYEEQRQAKELATPYIAFEALTCLLAARMQGYSEEEVRTCWPDTWGISAVSLPASVMLELVHGWIEYKQGEPGRTLGEVFQLEGRGQGKHKAIALQISQDRHREYAIRVVLYYTQQPGISLAASIERAAKDFGVSDDTMQLAYDEHGKQLIAKARAAGVLKGG